MNEPSHPGNALWTRLRAEQDRALAERSGDPASEQALVLSLTDETQASRPRRALRRVAILGGLAVVLLAAAAVRRRPLDLLPAPGDPEAPTLVAEAGSELPLRFADGSTITFLPGSSGQVHRPRGGSAAVEVRRGRLDAHVVHAPGVRWVVRAGPFRVHVTGTRFGVDWSPGAGVLAVTLREGSVVVDGGALGAGVPLRAGQKLRVGLDGVVRTDATAATDPDDTRAVAAAPTPPGSAAPTEAVASATAPGWRALAERGAYREALRAAERGGLPAQLETLDAHALLALGDVARYAGAPETAVRTFGRLVARFPRHRLAADAVFSLGRLSFEAGHAHRAATWFGRYVRQWPGGPLAEQAAGRLVESAARAGDRPAARQAARDYLQRAPQGTYAPLARSVLAAGGPPEATDR